MRNLCTEDFSTAYSVRLLNEADIPEISALCRGNTQFYAYCGQPFSEDILREDLRVMPPGKDIEDKYYAGFYEADKLCAVIDLIDGYPDAQTAFIGFFMLDHRIQGAGRGTAIIADLCTYLRGKGFASVRLGIDRDNPQSMHFWKKNGFAQLREIEREGGVIVLAQKML